MSVSIVTGANRGIGLALTAALKGRGQTVLAVCRTSSKELDALGVEVLSGVDVSREEQVQKISSAVGSRSVELLINNAGILVWGDTLSAPKYDGMMRQFEVNAVAPVRVTSALREQLQRGAKVAVITSRMGSIADNTSGGAYGYRMSKAALNIAAVSMAHDLKKAEVSVIVLHPGMVKTDMIGGRGEVTPDQAAAGLLARIDELRLETTGRFFHQNGEPLPW